MKTAIFALGVVVYLVALAVPAKADQIENLVFTGTATCLDSLCSSFGNGPVTGAYTLDVTMQSIVGAWSFSTPFGMISSADTGAYTQVDVPFSIPGVERENVYFETNTNTLGGYQFVALFFPNTDLSQTGPVDSNNSGRVHQSLPARTVTQTTHWLDRWPSPSPPACSCSAPAYCA